MEMDGTTYVEQGSLLSWSRKGKGEYKKREGGSQGDSEIYGKKSKTKADFKKSNRNEDRNSEIHKRYVEDKWTLSACGEQFGLSRERVRQILGDMTVPGRRIPRAKDAKPVVVTELEHKNRVALDLERFKEIASQIATALRADQAITIQPKPEIADAFERAIETVEKEGDRIRRLRENSGRPRKPDAELSKSGISMRKLREKWKNEVDSLPESKLEPQAKIPVENAS